MGSYTFCFTFGFGFGSCQNLGSGSVRSCWVFGFLPISSSNSVRSQFNIYGIYMYVAENIWMIITRFVYSLTALQVVRIIRCLLFPLSISPSMLLFHEWAHNADRCRDVRTTRKLFCGRYFRSALDDWYQIYWQNPSLTVTTLNLLTFLLKFSVYYINSCLPGLIESSVVYQLVHLRLYLACLRV